MIILKDKGKVVASESDKELLKINKIYIKENI